MSKYCIECGNELPIEARFCTKCGKQQEDIKQQDKTIKQIDKESKGEIQVSTGPAALDLKAAYNLVSESKNIIENLVLDAEELIKNGKMVDVFTKQIVNNMESYLNY